MLRAHPCLPPLLPLLLPLFPTLALLACGAKPVAPEAAATAAPTTAAAPAAPTDEQLRTQAAADVLTSMDLTADPCTDFYRYACGGWMDHTQRPADQAGWIRSFSVIGERNRVIMRELLEQAAADPDAGGPAGVVPVPQAAGDWRRMGDLYGSCMDLDAVEAAGITPVQPLLDAVAGLTRADQFPAVLAQLQAAGVGAIFDIERGADLKDPNTNSAYASQGGLGLPDRDYYLKDDDASVALQTAYRAFVAQMLSLSGVEATQATADADAIYAFEKDLATFSLPKADLRDPEKIYNPTDAAALQALAPQLDFATLAKGLGLSLDRPLVLHNTEWFAKAGQLVGATDPATLRAYLRFRVISSASDFLPDAFGQARFDFYGQQIYGQPQRKERWKRCVDAANHYLGDALGRFYVQTTFPGDSKEIALSMVHDIQHAFSAELPTVDWMDDQTRTVADEKAGAVDDKIGYPDTWLDTSTMEISVQPYGVNALAGRRFYV
ncbi:MAG: hypothetical protein GXP62_04410, partial [Oligoflexia bacterium]|nr:hypothetical protein [Oligoflexia bacterium]